MAGLYSAEPMFEPNERNPVERQKDKESTSGSSRPAKRRKEDPQAASDVVGMPSSLSHTRTWESNQVGHPVHHRPGIAVAYNSPQRHEAIRYSHLEI